LGLRGVPRLGPRQCEVDTINARQHTMISIRKETDSLGEIDIPADKLWGAQTQ
jgi:fumarate hydratase class II